MKRRLYISPEYFELIASAMRMSQFDLVCVEEMPRFLNTLKTWLLANGVIDLHSMLIKEETRMMATRFDD